MNPNSAARSPTAPAAVGPGQAAGDKQFRLLVDSIRDYAILSLDVTGHITSWNVGAEHIKGYTAAEILGQHFSVFYPLEDVANGRPEAELVTAAANGRMEDEGWRVRKDGSRFWANVVITALYDEAHQLRGYGKVTRDMSERRAAEQELQASEERLRQTTVRLAAANEGLRRQTVELSQARDRAEQATQEAQAATRAKSAFLATMSHEIRTPLNAVIGMTSLLLETELAREQREFLEIVHSSGESLLSIVNDILDFSKIESGHLDLEQVPFDLRNCVDNAVAQLGHVAAQRGLELVAQIGQECPQIVVGDSSRFRQVIVNLLSNAVKFTASGKVTVTTACQQLTDRGEGAMRISVTVRDTGSGISADRMHRLFQPFSQVDSSNTRVYGGTGLGLVISRRLAQAMGGDIEVASSVGVGSTFSFTALLTGRPDAVDEAAARAAAALAGRSALLVDDSAASRAMLSQLLLGWGMACTVASSGAEALEVLASGGPVDVAVIDLGLPGEDGLQLASALRALPTSAKLPIILLTDMSSRLDATAAATVDGMVSKPVRGSALHAKLLQLLAPDANAGPAASSVENAPDDVLVRAPLQVLLAEDNPVNQRVGQLMLQRLGQNVDVVVNGSEALAALHANYYDVVLMDVQMPEMDGLEATRRTRTELPPARQPYILAMTANALDEDWAACVTAGMDGYLPKPVRVNDLKAALSQVPRRGSAALSRGRLSD